MITPEEVFPIGRLSRTHGIHGELELQFTDDAFDRGSAEYLVLLVDGIFVPFFFKEYRFKNQEAALIKFDGVTTEKAARRLVGTSVFYPHAALPPDDTPEIRSLHAFTGFTVLLPDTSLPKSGESGIETRELGKIAHVIATTASAVFTVIDDEGEETLIPFHEDFLIDCNLHERYLVLHLPEGILELND